MLNEFIKLNKNIDTIIRKVKREIKYKDCECYLGYTHSNDDVTEMFVLQ